MRQTLRLLASVQRTTQFLEPGTPTGLTGLLTHSAPRSTLLYLYSSTLEQLQILPSHSVYRQSTEALTKHRMNIVESVKPKGLEEWQSRIEQIVDAHPEAFRKIPLSVGEGKGEAGKKAFNIIWRASAAEGMKSEEWDDEYVGKPQLEGPREEEERSGQGEAMARDLREENAKIPRIEPEPALTKDQINEIEQQIGAGLIEEIIQVAEGEKTLVEDMVENKPWEDLEESPDEGQWKYFERDTQVPETQAA